MEDCLDGAGAGNGDEGSSRCGGGLKGSQSAGMKEQQRPGIVDDAESRVEEQPRTNRTRKNKVTQASADRSKFFLAPKPYPPLHPALLWIVLRDKTYLTFPHGKIHHLDLDYDDIEFRVSAGSMLFLVFCDRSCCLMNPSTGGATPQQISLDKDDMDQRYHSFDRISKVVVSDKIVALLAMDKVKIFARGQPQGFGTCSAKVWEPPGETHVVDIAIFKEKLYVLAAEYGNGCLEPPELHALDTCDEQAAVSSVQCVSAAPRDHVKTDSTAGCQLGIFFYLVASGHQLLLVERQVDVDHWDPFYVRAIRTRFEVSEAVGLSGSGPGHWSKVDTLMGACSVCQPRLLRVAPCPAWSSRRLRLRYDRTESASSERAEEGP
ncbi:uncharacterized protein [Aegilops tauschii subsp. strangulata]|uniref:uncharacterized protein n=1 Tax=Aegilops tauschii subsp. strangulata TaxID=200361 RepID=UPI001ABC2DCC|nr:uncharacterized protein LOC120975337 [Aegilops tauschii subsp. strangulata]